MNSEFLHALNTIFFDTKFRNESSKFMIVKYCYYECVQTDVLTHYQLIIDHKRQK